MLTVYGVQPFFWDECALAKGPLTWFVDEAEAIKAAERAYAHYAGVRVFSLTGTDEFDYWRDSVTVKAFGYTPAGDAELARG